MLLWLEVILEQMEHVCGMDRRINFDNNTLKFSTLAINHIHHISIISIHHICTTYPSHIHLYIINQPKIYPAYIQAIQPSPSAMEVTLDSNMTSYSNSPCAGVTMDFPTSASRRCSHCPVAGMVLKAIDVLPNVSWASSSTLILFV